MNDDEEEGTGASQGRAQAPQPGVQAQALPRAVKDGVPVAARDLGLEPAQLYAWRAKAQQQGQDAEAL